MRAFLLEQKAAQLFAYHRSTAALSCLVQGPNDIAGGLCAPQSARYKGPVQSVFAGRVEDLVRKNERPAIHCHSALVAQERREVSAGIRSREGRSERNGSGVLVCDGRPHILGADILGAAEVPGSFSDH